MVRSICIANDIVCIPSELFKGISERGQVGCMTWVRGPDVTKHKRKVSNYKAILIIRARDFFQSKQQLLTANLQPQPAVIVLQ